MDEIAKIEQQPNPYQNVKMIHKKTIFVKIMLQLVKR
jgi:hypothetical protein